MPDYIMTTATEGCKLDGYNEEVKDYYKPCPFSSLL